ncbi:MAG: DUF6125 family protein [Promethearchaeota archaeon]
MFIKLSDKDKLFYFEKNFFTLDGLWVVEIEKVLGLEDSLKIDLAVWKQLLTIAYRRIRKYLGIEKVGIKEAIKIMGFRWSAEGWDYTIEACEDDFGRIIIFKCPYREIMDRNPERKPLIPRICIDICIPIYIEAVESLNPNIKVRRDCMLGLGSDKCTFELTIRDKSKG